MARTQSQLPILRRQKSRRLYFVLWQKVAESTSERYLTEAFLEEVSRQGSLERELAFTQMRRAVWVDAVGPKNVWAEGATNVKIYRRKSIFYTRNSQ